MTTFSMDWFLNWTNNFDFNIHDESPTIENRLTDIEDELNSSVGNNCGLRFPNGREIYLTEKNPFLSLNSKDKDPPYFLPEKDEYYEDPSDIFTIMVDPRTGVLVTDPFNHAKFSKMFMSVPEEKQCLKPYHWSQDHDYFRIEESEVEKECKSSGLDIVEKIFKSEDEPVVEVWKIDNFYKDPSVADSVPEQLPCSAFKKETRRTSIRTAEIKRREQTRKLSNAVHAVLKSDKAQRTRQRKSEKPKNSVETTPSQSDIEEWYSQPLRPTSTKITKKTSKGRIDHSESERHRREVLRENFSFLSDLIPNKYLRGEKMSSQISKQKILNGAKAYIVEMHSAKSSYKSQYHQNKLLRERWQKKKSHKLLRCVKKRK